MITFAVIAHNEARYLPTSIGQALEAAGDGDRVILVDSDSSDDSVEVAAALGVDVVRAPLGKGRAVAAALEHCHDGAICLIDGDIEASDSNIPAALAAHWADSDADMVVAEFEWVGKGPMLTIEAVYRPLVSSLFPEAAGGGGVLLLSGFRILDGKLPLGALPPGFGVEAHIEALLALDGHRVETVHVGRYWGPVRDKRDLGAPVAEALFDLAEKRGRLAPEHRAEWDEWVDSVLTITRRRDGTDGNLSADDSRRLEAILTGPRPPVA